MLEATKVNQCSVQRIRNRITYLPRSVIVYFSLTAGTSCEDGYYWSEPLFSVAADVRIQNTSVSSVDNCKMLCVTDPTCIGINFISSVCYIVPSTADQLQYITESNFYLLLRFSCNGISSSSSSSIYLEMPKDNFKGAKRIIETPLIRPLLLRQTLNDIKTVQISKI
jgi:hypothetical protein